MHFVFRTIHKILTGQFLNGEQVSVINLNG